MPTAVLSGEIAIRSRPNGEPEHALRRIVPQLEQQGLFVTDLEDRRMTFRLDLIEARRTVSDLDFLLDGSATSVERRGRWRLRYHARVKYPNWWLAIAAATAGVGLALSGLLPFRFGIVVSIPLPVLSLAAFGHRTAMERRVRRLFTEAIDGLPGLDC